MNKLLRRIFRDPLEVELGPVLRTEIDPRAIVDYGLPAYKDYQLRRLGRAERRIRKMLSQRSRARLVQERDYLRLGTFRETETWRFLAELDEANLDWRCVARYRDFRQRIEAGEVVHLRSKRQRMTTVADLEPYFEQYATLLRSMREHGYVATSARDRITILIDARGGIMKETKGRHRLAAAQIVGVPSVPVRISHVHAGWVTAQPGVTRAERTRRAIERALGSLR